MEVGFSWRKSSVSSVIDGESGDMIHQKRTHRIASIMKSHQNSFLGIWARTGFLKSLNKFNLKLRVSPPSDLLCDCETFLGFKWTKFLANSNTHIKKDLWSFPLSCRLGVCVWRDQLLVQNCRIHNQSTCQKNSLGVF